MTTESASTGIVLFGHGSSVEDANQGVRDLAKQVRDAGPYQHVRAAFLELAQPDLNAAVAEAAAAGLARVIIIPYFLTVGIHLRRDLPHLIAPLQQKYPRLTLEVGASLEGHPMMASIILGRVREVMEKFKSTP